MRQFICLSLLAASAIATSAQRFNDGILNYQVISPYEKTCKVTGLVDIMYPGIVTIPETIEGYTVTEFGGAFQMMEELSGIVIPSTVKTIDLGAFIYCRKLATVELSEGLESIAEQAFRETAISNIHIPESVVSLGENAFQDCKNLHHVHLPSELTSISGGLFSGCESLTEIVIPENVSSIGAGAFTKSALESIVIPKSVTKIENNTFRRCIALKSIEMPDGLTRIGNYAFNECSALTGIKLPDNITSIGEGAFAGCTALKSINLPSMLSIIAKELMTKCNSLTEVVLPENATSIGEAAFSFCDKLERIHFRRKIESVGNYAFFGCPEISEIASEVLEPFTLPANCFEQTAFSANLTVPHGSREKYARAEVWSSFTNITEDYFPYIADLETTKIAVGGVVPPPTVESADGSGKEYTITLSSDRPETVTINADGYIQALAAGNALIRISAVATDGSELSSNVVVTVVDAPFNDGILKYEVISAENHTCRVTGTFNYDGMESYSIPSSVLGYKVTEIEAHALSMYVGELTIPCSVKLINGNISSFKIESMVIEDSEEALSTKPDSFRELSRLYIGRNWAGTDDENAASLSDIPDVEFGSKVTAVPDHAFNNSPYADRIHLSDNITSIGAFAFSGTNISGFTMPSAVRYIGESAFEDCAELTEVIIPASVEYLGDRAFANCHGLTEITVEWEHALEASEDVFSTYTFENATLRIPENTRAYYMKVNPWKNFLSINDGSSTGVESISADMGDYIIFTTGGLPVSGRITSPGIYIIKDNSSVKKIYLR